MLWVPIAHQTRAQGLNSPRFLVQRGAHVFVVSHSDITYMVQELCPANESGEFTADIPLWFAEFDDTAKAEIKRGEIVMLLDPWVGEGSKQQFRHVTVKVMNPSNGASMPVGGFIQTREVDPDAASFRL